MTRASRISRHHSASSWFNVNHSRYDLSGRWPSRLVATANPAGVLVFRTERAAPAPRETSAGRTSLPGAFAGQRPDWHKKDRRRGGRTHVALRQSPSFFCGQRAIPLSIQKITMGLYPCGSHYGLTLAKVVRDSCIHRGWLAAYDNGEVKSRAGIQIHASSHPKD